jgi:glycosyltransferase involved in cell wall biosynthesis
MSARPPKIAHLVSHPIPYFAPLYRELAGRPEIDLTVYFYSDASACAYADREFGRSVAWDRSLLDGYRWKFCPSAARTDISTRFLKPPNWDIVREVASGRFDVLWVHGYAHATTWLAAAAARARGMRVLIRDEQTLLHGRSVHKRVLKAGALRALYSQSSGLYIGEENRRYFAYYGMPAERMYPARYCVDNRYYRDLATALRPRRDEIRFRFGIVSSAPVVLFCGKLIEKKQPLMLVEPFARVRAQQPCSLLIAGDGALGAAAEALVARLAVPDVHFAGFLDQHELPFAYAAADIFVLPSALHETWGLVVNEAMNFGLPIVVSDKVGCAQDLVRDSENGFVVAHESPEELAHAIERLVSDGALREAFGSESLRIIERYSVEACADGVVAACLAGEGRRTAWRQEALAS